MCFEVQYTTYGYEISRLFPKQYFLNEMIQFACFPHQASKLLCESALVNPDVLSVRSSCNKLRAGFGGSFIWFNNTFDVEPFAQFSSSCMNAVN